MKYLQKVDTTHPDFGDLYDEVALWSAPFGFMLLDRVPMKRGLTILDVGAGTGFTTIEMAQRCGPDSTVIAVDPWAAGMRRLRRKVEYLGLTNVRLMEQDAARLDIPDAAVDLIISNLGLNNFTNADAVLRECLRVAKPGARLVLTTNLVGHMREFYDAYRAVLTETGPAECLPALEAHINHRATVDSLCGQLLRAKFEIESVFTDHFRMRFADGSSFLRHYFIRIGFLPAWKSVLPVDAIERTFAALEMRLDALAAQRGALELSIPAVCLDARK